MLILVRHGRTAHNASRRLLGRLDVPLDPLGVRQAEALGAALKGAHRVVSSPLERALRTAEAFGLPVTVDERWVEIDYGVYDGFELADVPASLWANWRTDLSWTPERGESLSSVARRVREACDSLWEEACGRDVIVVTHVSPIKAAAAWALGAPDEILWRMFLDVASVCRIAPGAADAAGTAPPAPVLHSFNETLHRPSV